MTTLDLRPEALLPHDHPMILIDEIVEFDDSFVVASVTPALGKPFASEHGNVPVWIGMEYMAQTIGAYAGIKAQQSGEPVRVGFLLGTRSYDTDIELFKCNETYMIAVARTYEDGGLSAFECTIRLSEEQQSRIIAKATINTFQPDNVDAFMEAGEQ